MEGKTAREWFESIPPAMRKDILRITPKEKLKVKYDCLSEAIKHSFLWEESRLGYIYWERMYSKLAHYGK